MSKYKVHQLADIPNYSNREKYGFLVSQPKNYLGTFAVINIGMGLMYAFSTHTDLWVLIALSAIFHVLVIVFMLILAWVDPGIIPKIFSNY